MFYLMKQYVAKQQQFDVAPPPLSPNPGSASDGDNGEVDKENDEYLIPVNHILPICMSHYNNLDGYLQMVFALFCKHCNLYFTEKKMVHGVYEERLLQWALIAYWNSRLLLMVR